MAESSQGEQHRKAATNPLTAREKLILKLKQRGWYYREIGEELGISGERVRQLLCRALRKLRD